LVKNYYIPSQAAA
jgi:protein phosphatase 2C family protein 2/3